MLPRHQTMQGYILREHQISHHVRHCNCNIITCRRFLHGSSPMRSLFLGKSMKPVERWIIN